ncbi:MAG: D-sedoheptulose-7-phosphate isomerase [Candidatus Binatia bacterium]
MKHFNGAARQLATEFVQEFLDLLSRIDLDEIERVFHILRKARDHGGTIYLAGNGGSASTASHWANDLGKATKASQQNPIRVISLTDNVSWLTALANDEGYERAIAGQLENFAQPGDVLAVISASGNSPNLVRAVEMAHARGVVTVGLLGFDGGALKSMVDASLLLPSRKGAYGLVESGHGLLCHILSACLAADRAEGLDGLARAMERRGEMTRADH